MKLRSALERSLGLLLASACGGSLSGVPSPQSFDQQMARAVCEHYRDCEGEGFEAVFEDLGACTSDYLDSEQRRSDCTFDRDQADTCMREMAAATDRCEPIEEILILCRKSWSCYTPCHELTDYFVACGLGGGEVIDDPDYCRPDSSEACYAECGLDQSCAFFTEGNREQDYERYRTCLTECE